MLTVVLSVLRIIGLILLALIGVALALLLMVLFLPVVYRASIQKQADDLKAAIKVRWLFGLLRARFLYPVPGSLVVKVLFFTVFDSGKEEPPRKEIREKKRRTKRRHPEDLEEEREEDPAAGIYPEKEALPDVTAGGQYDAKEEPGEWATEDEKAARERAAAWEKVQALLRGEKPKSKFDKFRYTIHNIYDRIKGVCENITYYKEVLTDDQSQRLFRHIVFRAGKILKSIRPRKLDGNVVFGTGSPDTTGYILGIYSMFAYRFGEHFRLTPDFEQKILEADFYAAGHITAAVLLWNGIMLVLDRKLKKFISRIKREGT